MKLWHLEVLFCRLRLQSSLLSVREWERPSTCKCLGYCFSRCAWRQFFRFRSSGSFLPQTTPEWFCSRERTFHETEAHPFPCTSVSCQPLEFSQSLRSEHRMLYVPTCGHDSVQATTKAHPPKCFLSHVSLCLPMLSVQ